MKSFWISCVVVELVLLQLAAPPPILAAKGKKQDPGELTNFLLSPRYSQWLVGPVAHIASAEEAAIYLSLQVDEEATAFISAFWEKRGGEAVFPTRSKKSIFDERVAEADRVFDEGTFRGHRTDRGTIFVLYGEPEEIRFEQAPRGRGEYLEIWEYAKDTGAGLDERKPERLYHFVKRGERTIFYRGPMRRQIR